VIKERKLDYQRVECEACQGRHSEACEKSGYSLKLVKKPITRKALQARAGMQARPVFTRQCQYCDTPFLGQDQRRIYCSVECRIQTAREAERARNARRP